MSTIFEGRAPRSGNRLSDQKRAAILAGAKRVFMQNGFGGANMDEVAAAARVSKMTVYRHFGSKEDLFAGVITEMCHGLIPEQLQDIFNREPRRALRAFARKMVEILFNEDSIELHRLAVAECRRFPMLGQLFFATGPQVCIEALQGYLMRHKADPRFKVEDPRRSAEEFLDLLRGYSHLKMLLGIERTPAWRVIEIRIESAIDHILR